MKTIEFYGGFHRVRPIRLHVSDRQATEIEALDDDFDGLEYILSDYQMRRLERHFCGIDGCCCGGVHRDVICEIL